MPDHRSTMSRRRALALTGAALVLPRAAQSAGLSALSGRAFGTTWRMIAATEADLAPLARRIDGLFAGIDATFSPYRVDSSLSRFNVLTGEMPLRDHELADVTAAALTIAEASGGAFDPTVGPLVARWGFGPITRGGAPDWRGLTVRAGAVIKARGDLTLDLCGIAKGWALDQAMREVARFGLSDVLFELGGEFAARGRHPEGRSWQVGVAMGGDGVARAPVLRLENGRAVATSGIGVQSYRHDGRLYSHVIDTDTAQPVGDALHSVTVMARDAMRADGWATALCAAGAEAGPDLARRLGIAALFLIEGPSGLVPIQTGAIGEALT